MTCAMNPDSNENAISIWRKRLAFRAWHRGTREADLLIGGFADKNLADFDEAGLSQFEALLACPDPDLYEWMIGRSSPPDIHDHRVMRLLKEFNFARSNRNEI